MNNTGHHLRRQLCGDGRNGRHCQLFDDDHIHETHDGTPKKNAAQKRQDQRTERRRKRGVHRTEEMAMAERERKHRQGNDRLNDAADPWEPGFGDPNYALELEMERAYLCRMYGLEEDCNWHALDYDWPNDGHGGYDQDFIHGEHYPYNYYPYDYYPYD